MIIHACSVSPKKTNPTDLQSFSESFHQNPGYFKGLDESYSVNAKDNVSKNPVYDYCINFVNNIPSKQCKNGEPVILFLDGHSSQWDVSSLT